MLRKSVLMPKSAMAFTIAASVLGQVIGSRAERYRLKTVAARKMSLAETPISGSRQLQIVSVKGGHCGNLVEYPVSLQSVLPPKEVRIHGADDSKAVALVFGEDESCGFGFSTRFGEGAAANDSDITNINLRREENSSNSETKEKAEEEDFWSMYPRLNESLKLEQFSEYTLPDSGINFIEERLSSIGNLKAKELEEKWKKLQVAETELKLVKEKLIQQQTELILNLIS
ncbi:hypothetical protein GH714_034550 [Hevea brasiliensis]|uniref:Uncharacterized protein n=1 Tax=Hevea brasiliensis TaxID=3981 RepID=A0A6A6L362_HEVBR|nr:hypothetical protein GH714_034550 [Hevea brasiliensis]